MGLQNISNTTNSGGIMKKRYILLWALVAVAVGVSFSANVRANDEKPGSNQNKCKYKDWADVDEFSTTVNRVVDGDTIKVKAKKQLLSVRFLLIDTPETHYMGKTQGYWGDKASERLAKILPERTKITVKLGEEKCDKFGRLLGYVFKGDVNVNMQMLEEGLAVNYCIYPNLEHCEEAAELVQKNVEEETGMFSDPSLELPYEWRRRVSDRPFDKYLGDIKTKTVFAPGAYDKVGVGYRVFFMKKSHINPPFHLEE